MVMRVILKFLFLANITGDSTYYITTVTECSEQDRKNNLLLSCMETQVYFLA